MAILSTNQKLIKVDVGYSAGNGIDITSGVISVTGDNAPYSAGQNIYFDGDDNHVINGKDWGNEINDASANAFNEASAWVAQNYANSADLTYLSGVVDNKLDTSAWSSVSADMATEQYVIANGNMVFGRSTAWVNDQNYSTVSQLESVSSDLNTNKLDASSYHELTAGENIDIQNYIISSKDWTNDIQNSSANAYNESTGYVNNWIEETYSTDKNALSAAIDYVSANAGDQEVNSLVHSNSGEWNNVSAKLDTTAYTPFDPSYMSGAIDEKLDTTAFSTVSGDFLTAIPDEYATKDFVSNSITGKLDISSFSSVSGDFLTNDDLNGYATETFVQDTSANITALIPTDYYPDTNPSGFITGVDLSNYYTKTDTSSKEEISAAIAAIPLGDEEVNQAVHTNSATWNTVSDKLDTTAFSDVSGSFLTAHQSLDGYATEQWVENKGYLTAHQDLSDYYTKSQTSGADELAQAFSNIPLGDEAVNSAVHELSGTWNEVSSKLDTTAFSDVSGTFLTAQQNADWTATAGVTQILNKPEEVSYELLNISAGPGIDIQDTQDALVISSTIDVSNKLDTTSFSDVSSTFLTAVPTSTMDVSLLDLTNGGQISGYNGTAFYSQGGGGGTGDMETALLEYNADDQITGYNGSAFAGQGGGGEVPTGTMNVSGLEYNAVGEISGYGSSAIAQYGAEKQWLVHDDTLVHASNSAQYALGVNLSALQRLMGIDETVLYNNTAATTTDVAIGSTFDINEPITNFNKFKIYFSRFSITSNGASNGGPCSQIREYDSTACSSYFVINETFPTSTAQNSDWFDISMLIETTGGTTWKCKACYQSKLPSGSLDRGWTYLKPYKVIGIGRKQ